MKKLQLYITSNHAVLAGVNDLLNNPKYIVERIYPSFDHAKLIITPILYTTAEDLTDTELDQLQAAKVTASVVAQDEKYLSLKNQTERELFLLNGFGINSEQAKAVMTLAAMLIRGNLPQMGSAK
jgi:hypothetical protein